MMSSRDEHPSREPALHGLAVKMEDPSQSLKRLQSRLIDVL